MEEYKIAEAYLEKNEDGHDESCPYCQQTDSVDPEHCTWCHGADVAVGEAHCPYCDMGTGAGQAAEMPELDAEDCNFCREMDSAGKADCKFCNEDASKSPEALVSPDSNNETAPAGSDDEREQYKRMGMAPPEIGKPDPSKEMPIGQNAPMDTEPKDFPEEGSPAGKSDPRLDGSIPQGGNIDPEDEHSREALTSIADEITNQGTPLASQVDGIDDAEMDSGMASEGNISRPEGFEQNTPEDMGTGGPNPPEEGHSEPDLSDVLEEGLNDHADGIQRERVIQTVSQALTQFKNAKQGLEEMRMTNPQLYQASISMLKAMIEMASLLGLGQGDSQSASQPGMVGQSEQTESNLGQEQESLMPPQEEQNDEWHDPFPAHPDHGGDEKPGHAPPSKSKENSDSPQR